MLLTLDVFFWVLYIFTVLKSALNLVNLNLFIQEIYVLTYSASFLYKSK